MGCAETNNGNPGGAASWSDVLLIGNPSGGTDPLITSGDSIIGEPSTVGNGGAVPIVGGSTTFAGGDGGLISLTTPGGAANAGGTGGDGGAITSATGVGGAGTALGNLGGIGGPIESLTGAGGAGDGAGAGGIGGLYTGGLGDGGAGGGAGGAGGDGGSATWTMGDGGAGNGAGVDGDGGSYTINLGSAGVGGAGGSAGTFNVNNGDALLSDRLSVGGGAFSDAVAASDDVVVGDLASANSGVTILSTGDARIMMTAVSGVVDGQIQYAASEFLFAIGGTNRLRLTGTVLRPHSDNGLELGTTTRRFGNVHLFENVIFYTTSTGLKSVDQTAGVGLTLLIDGSDTSNAGSDGGPVSVVSGSASGTGGGDGGAIASTTAAGGVNAAGTGGTGGAITEATGAGGAATALANVGGVGGAITQNTGIGGLGDGAGAGGAGGAITRALGNGGTSGTGVGGVGGAMGTTTGAGGAGGTGGNGANGGAITETTGAGGAGNGAGDGGTGGAINRTAGAAGAAGATGDGGVGGAIADITGAGSAGGATSGDGLGGGLWSVVSGVGGAGSATVGDAGPGGSATFNLGDGGAEGSSGDGGDGGTFEVHAGNGGDSVTLENGAGGDVILDAGLAGTGANGATDDDDGSIFLQIDGTNRWVVTGRDISLSDTVGDLMPGADSTQSIGKDTVRPLNVFGDNFHGVDGQLAYTVPGTLTVALDQAFGLRPSKAFTIEEVFVEVLTAPTGATLIVDVEIGGVSIFAATPANRPTIAIGAFTATSGAPDTTAAAKNAAITIDVDQIGSTIAGADLTVMVRGVLA